MQRLVQEPKNLFHPKYIHMSEHRKVKSSNTSKGIFHLQIFYSKAMLVLVSECLYVQTVKCSEDCTRFWLTSPDLWFAVQWKLSNLPKWQQQNGHWCHFHVIQQVNFSHNKLCLYNGNGNCDIVNNYEWQKGIRSFCDLFSILWPFQ